MSDQKQSFQQESSTIQAHKDSAVSVEVTSGYMQIKRRMFWVIRYGEILNGSFQYYENKGDTEPRKVFSLSGSNINELSPSSGGDYIIQFTTNHHQRNQRILLRFDNQQDYKLWLRRLTAGAAAQQSQQPKLLTQQSSLSQTQSLSQSSQSSTQQTGASSLLSSEKLTPAQSINQERSNIKSSANSVVSSSQQLFISASEKQLSQYPSKSKVNRDVPQNSQDQRSIQRQVQQSQSQSCLQQQHVQLQKDVSGRSATLPLSQLEDKDKRDSDLQKPQKKTKSFILDSTFLTAEQSPGSLLSLKKNLQIAFETCFNQCNTLCDVSKDIKLYCSEAVLEAQSGHCSSTGDSNSNNESDDSQSNQRNNVIKSYLGGDILDFLDSDQMKVGAGLCVILISLIIYQCLRCLDNINVVVTMFILVNLICLPVLSKKYADTHKIAKRNRKSKHHGKNHQKKHGLKVEIYFNHSLNEFLFALTRCCEDRSEWQIGVTQSQKKLTDQSLQITYKSNEIENIAQNVFKDGSTLYVTEQHANNHSFLRIFSIPLNTISERGFMMNYYFYSNASKISDVNQIHNSPALICGLSLYLDNLKRSPTSSIFTYQRSLLDHESVAFNQSVMEVQNGLKSSRNEKSMKESTSQLVQQQKQQLSLRNEKLPVIPQEKPKEELKQQDIEETEEEKEEEKKEDNPSTFSSLKPVENLPLTTPTEDNLNTPLQPEKPQKSYFLEGEAGELYNAKLDDALNLLTKVYPLNPENNWKEGNCNQDLLRHSKIDEKSGNVMSRGESTINRSAQSVLEFLKDRTKRSQWDESFKEGKRVEELSPNASIEYNIFKGMLTVSDRDMVLFQTTFEFNGNLYLVAFSVPYAKIPENKKPVRATLIIAGWIITPKSENKCQCVYITCADLNGSIGKTIKDMVAKQQGGGVLKVKNAIEKK